MHASAIRVRLPRAVFTCVRVLHPSNVFKVLLSRLNQQNMPNIKRYIFFNGSDRETVVESADMTYCSHYMSLFCGLVRFCVPFTACSFTN